MKKVTGELPFGWTKRVEDDGRIVFVNAEKNVQSFTDPRLAFAEEEKAGPLRQRFDGSSNALSILHGKDLTGKIALITGTTQIRMINSRQTIFLFSQDLQRASDSRPQSR